EERGLLAALANGDDVARLEAHRRDRRLLAVDREVTVGNVLASCVDRRRHARAEHERIQTRLEHLHQVVTGRARHAGRGLVRAAKLLLAHVVLEAKPLLLEQLDAVVRRPTATALAVLSRRERAILHVLLCLWCQRDTEGTGLLNLGSREIHVCNSSLRIRRPPGTLPGRSPMVITPDTPLWGRLVRLAQSQSIRLRRTRAMDPAMP